MNSARADKYFAQLTHAQTGTVEQNHITTTGKKLIPKLAHAADVNDDTFFNPLSKDDKNHLLRIMKTLVKAHKLIEKPTE